MKNGLNEWDDQIFYINQYPWGQECFKREGMLCANQNTQKIKLVFRILGIVFDNC